MAGERVKVRCLYCDKLLGVSRRKAGTIVKCPNCSEPLVVPNAEQTELEQQGPSPFAGSMTLPGDYGLGLGITDKERKLTEPPLLSSRNDADRDIAKPEGAGGWKWERQRESEFLHRLKLQKSAEQRKDAGPSDRAHPAIWVALGGGAVHGQRVSNLIQG